MFSHPLPDVSIDSAVGVQRLSDVLQSICHLAGNGRRTGNRPGIDKVRQLKSDLYHKEGSILQTLVIALPYAVALLVTGMLPRRHALTALRRWLRSKTVVAAFVGTFCVWMVVRNILQI